MKRIVFCIVFCLLFLCPKGYEVQAKVPKNASFYQGHFYYRYDLDMDWDEAEEYCEQMGGYLATITSSKENLFVLSLLRDCPNNAYWIGARLNQAGWEWVNGEKVVYDMFWPDQPDEAKSGMVLQFLKQEDAWGWDDTWNAGDKKKGEKIQGFVCEWGDKITSQKLISLDNISGAKKTDFYYGTCFSDKFFFEENSVSVANSGLMRLSALGAMSTYTQEEGSNAVAFLQKCGFRDVKKVFSKSGEPNGCSTFEDNNHGTIYCGWRSIGDGSRLFAFVVSGYSDGRYEWISNFRLDNGTLHAGFNGAAEEMARIAYAYIKEHAGKSNKVWIMGHSRGGALTNLLAIKLLEKGSKYYYSINLTKSDMYAYGFATPQYTTQEIPGYEKCLFNFVSAHDFVPCVAPSSWGYRRAGTDFVFENQNEMKQFYKLYSGSKYSGYTEEEKKQIIEEFNAFGKSQEEYVNGYTIPGQFSHSDEEVLILPQEYGMYGIGRAMTSEYSEGIKLMLKTPNSARLNVSLALDFLMAKINDSHEMLAYLAWIDANPVIK